jgi:hypothetical protein
VKKTPKLTDVCSKKRGGQREAGNIHCRNKVRACIQRHELNCCFRVVFFFSLLMMWRRYMRLCPKLPLLILYVQLGVEGLENVPLWLDALMLYVR